MEQLQNVCMELNIVQSIVGFHITMVNASWLPFIDLRVQSCLTQMTLVSLNSYTSDNSKTVADMHIQYDYI